MTIRQWLSLAADRLTVAGIDNEIGESRSLLAFALHCEEQELLEQGLMPDEAKRSLSEEELDRAEALLARRLHREPLQHILGYQWFYGYRFRVSPAVLIPRWDTENLVEACLTYLRGLSIEMPRVCDVCTGSGCIGISIALEQPGTQLTAVDISPEALMVAGQNARDLEVEIDFRRSDMLTAVDGRFELIVSNPPYIKSAELRDLQPEVRLFDPTLALDGGDDGLVFYRILALEAREHLVRDGLLALEIGADQAEAVTAILKEQGYEQLCVKQDLGGLDRVVLAVWPY